MHKAAAYELDARNLRLVGAVGRPLALDASAIGRLYPTSRADVAPGSDGSYLPAAEQSGPAGDRVAIVSVSGPLAQRGEAGLCALVDGYDWIGARLDAALESDAVGVVLAIDSPGGDASGLFEGVRRMRAAVEASGKPVVAYVDEFCASAAYAIACGVADAVYVPPTGRVGSIGCIIVHADATRAAEQDGLKYTLVRDPPGKAAGSPVEPLSDTAMARMKRDVGEYSARFASLVSDRRGMSLDAIRGLDGDMRAGSAAVDAGLADGVATLEQVIGVVASKAHQGTNGHMKTPKQILAALLGAAVEATDAELSIAAAQAAPVLALGERAIRLTGAADAETAEGTIRAWQDGASRAAASATELEKVRAREREREAADDMRERVATLTGLVAGGRMTPAEAWADPVAGAPGGIAEHFAEMKPRTFRAFAAGRAGAPAALAAPPAPAVTGAAARATDADEARQAGVSVESLRAARQRFAEATQGAS